MDENAVLVRLRHEFALLRKRRPGSFGALRPEEWSALASSVVSVMADPGRVWCEGDVIPEDVLLVYTGSSENSQMWDRTLHESDEWEMSGTLTTSELLARFGKVRESKLIFADDSVFQDLPGWPERGEAVVVSPQVADVLVAASDALKGLLAWSERSGLPLSTSAVNARTALNKCTDIISKFDLSTNMEL